MLVVNAQEFLLIAMQPHLHLLIEELAHCRLLANHQQLLLFVGEILMILLV